MITKAAITLNKQDMNVLTVPGIIESTTSMSLANLLMIRPNLN